MMKRTASLAAALSALLALPACASMDGSWPSLRTPAERASGKCEQTQPALADTGETAPQPAAAAPAQAGTAGTPAPQSAAPSVRAIAARMAEEQRDFDAAAQEWNRQRAVAEKAAAAARGAAPASEPWATAELEISRLNQTAARFDETRATVDRMAGELAVLAANGTDVRATLVEVGRLISRIEAAQSAHTSALPALQANLRR